MRMDFGPLTSEAEDTTLAQPVILLVIADIRRVHHLSTRISRYLYLDQEEYQILNLALSSPD